MPNNYIVTFLPDNTVVNVLEGTTLLQAAAEAGMLLEGPCGGKGTCGKCKVIIVEGIEERSVLACKTHVHQDISVIIPTKKALLLSKERDKSSLDTELEVTLDPGIYKKDVEVLKPGLDNQYSDLMRLYKALGKEIPISYTALKALPEVIRKDNGKVTVTFSPRKIKILEAGNEANELWGIALDIGTTTVVATLINLQTAEVAGTAAATNTQNIFGADIISRIEYVINNPQGLRQLQGRIIQAINNLIVELCKNFKVLNSNIFKVVVAANTAMEHLFLGIDPRYLAPAPFIPVFAHPLSYEAREIGLTVNHYADIHIIPNIAGYVGGDTTAVILATGIFEKQGTHLAVDIGTNGEIVLAVNGTMLTCSTAAGPAFEGAQIRFGMRAAPGAIEGIAFDQDISLEVIGDCSPTGICGSGLIQAIDVLVKIGVVNKSGRMLSRKEGEEQGLSETILRRLGTGDRGNYFILSPLDNTDNEFRAKTVDSKEMIVITQKDIRELQLAKGALRTGIEVLMKEARISVKDIDQVLLAGAFGNYISKESALFLGLLPQVPLDKIKTVGNAAGAGAKIALLSEPMRKKATDISKKVKHVELSIRSDFQEMFLDYLSF